MVIDSQYPHLQKILIDDALAVFFEFFHIPLGIDEATTEIFGAGEGEIECCGCW